MKPLQHAGSDDWDAHWSDLAAASEWNPAQRWRNHLLQGILATHDDRGLLADLGSGHGNFINYLVVRNAWNPARIVGLEASTVGVRMAAARLPLVRFAEADLVTGEGIPPEIIGRVSVTVCSEVLEHVDEPISILRTAFTLLQPGGSLLISVPGGPQSAYDRHIGHREHFTRERLARLASSAGFDVDFCDAAGWPFFNLYRLAVIASGQRLVTHATEGDGIAQAGRLMSGSLTRLMKMSRRRGGWGWQIVGRFAKPSVPKGTG